MTEWIEFSERLPGKTDWFLAYDTCGDIFVRNGDDVEYVEGIREAITLYGDDEAAVYLTHWLLLPPVPHGEMYAAGKVDWD